MNTPLLIGFVAFLLANLLLGLYKGQGVKTMKDYAVANRAMGTGTLMITIIATVVGCEYVTTCLIGSQRAGIIPGCCFVVTFAVVGLFLGRVVFPKLLRFKDCYTLGDIMGQHYGPKAQLLTGVISTLLCLLVIAAQLLALQNIAAMLGIKHYIIIGLVGVSITLYTFSGGMRAVAATDVLQFALVMGGFAFIAYQIIGLEVSIDGKIEKIKGIGDFMKKIQRTVTTVLKSQHLSILNHNERNRFFIGMLKFTSVFFSPAIINRVLASRNRPQVRQAFTGFVFFYAILWLTLTFIGFGLLLSYGYDAQNPISEHAVFHVIERFLFKSGTITSIMVQLILMMMLLGVIMSTADSYLNALVVVVIRDILQYKQAKKEPDTTQLKHVKEIALMAGLASIGLAYLFSSFATYSTTLANLSKDMFGCFAIFLIAAAFKLKGNYKTFLYTMVLFLSLFVITGVLFYTNTWVIGKEADWKNTLFRRKMIYAVVPILFATALAFLVIHQNVYGRLTWEQPKVKGEAVRQMGGTKAKWRTIFTNPLVWAKDTFARYGNEPTAVGLFVTLSSLVRVTISPRLHEGYTMIFTILNILTVLLCALLMIHTMWRQPFKSYFPLFYYGVLIYILPFMHMLLFLYQPQSIILMMQLAMSIILLHLLVDWRSYCLFTLIGWVAAGLVYWRTYLAPEKPIDETIALEHYDLIWIGFVTLATVLAIGFLFCSRQEQINTQRLMRTKTYAAGFGHDLLNLYQSPQFTIDYVHHAYKQGAKKDLVNQEAREWDDMARYMQECTAQAHAFKRLVKFDYIPQSEMKIMSIKALIEKAYGLTPNFLRDRIRIAPSRDFKVEVFPPFVNNIILNLVRNARDHGNAKEVVLSWEAATRRLYIKDNGSGIPSPIASKIGDLYTTSSQNGTGNGIGLAFVFMVVRDIFHAQIDFETSDKGTTFWIEFPPIKRGTQFQQIGKDT